MQILSVARLSSSTDAARRQLLGWPLPELAVPHHGSSPIVVPTTARHT